MKKLKKIILPIISTIAASGIVVYQMYFVVVLVKIPKPASIAVLIGGAAVIGVFFYLLYRKYKEGE